MSDIQGPASVPVVTTQGKRGVGAHLGRGSGCPHCRGLRELQAFLSLLEHSLLQDFLSNDPCFQISDKYLLAMVLVYFRRAQLRLSEYNLENLFLALFLANDMEEDLRHAKCVIFPWALGKDWQSRMSDFLHQRDRLWARMDFRAAVSRQCCEEVIAKEPSHWAWTRMRRPHHGGVQRGDLEARVPLPRGPGLSPPQCALCDAPPGHHLPCSQRLQPLPVLPSCLSPTLMWPRPPPQAYLLGGWRPLERRLLLPAVTPAASGAGCLHPPRVSQGPMSRPLTLACCWRRCPRPR